MRLGLDLGPRVQEPVNIVGFKQISRLTRASRAVVRRATTVASCKSTHLRPASTARCGTVTVHAAANPPRPPTGSPHIQAAIFTGSYAVIFGLALTLAPKSVFGLLFRSETVATGWIRVGGILFTLIGCQYLGTAGADRQGQGALGFYRATVWSRVALSAAFGLLVAVGESPVGLLLLAAVNLAGAVSMHMALKRSGIEGDGDGDGTGLMMKM